MTVSGGTGKQFVKVSGSTVTMTDRGDDCWGSADTCTFLNQKATGDGTWIVQVQSLDKTNDWAKAGIMARASLDQTSADVFLCVTPSHGVNLQYREHTGDNEGSTNPDNDQLQGAGTVAPIWLKLQKKGANWTAWMSSDGKNWTNQTAATQNPIDLGANFLVGLAATAHDNTQHGTAIFTGAQGFNGPFSADAVGTNDNA